MNYKNLDELKSFADFFSLKPVDLKKELNSKRINESNIPISSEVKYNWATGPISKDGVSVLQSLADEAGLIQKYKALLSGEIINTGEKRAVLHHLTRSNVLKKAVIIDGVNREDFYRGEFEKIKEFARQVHSGKIKGSTGRAFTDVCQIGIGGSDLGPRAISTAFKYCCSLKSGYLKPHFISNVDPDDASCVLRDLDPETTLFILVSKSGTTIETLTNKEIVKTICHSKCSAKGFDFSKHLLAVTSATSPLSSSKDVLKSFYIDDYVGGRYSVSSAVGALILSLSYGVSAVKEFLLGMAEADKNALNSDVIKNAPMLGALIGVYLRNVLNFPSLAILPYSQALDLFPSHLQQLDMESNGKAVNRNGESINNYQTGPVIFGTPGTNAQHSYFQHLHQSSTITPVEFIAFKKESMRSQKEEVLLMQNESQKKLNAALSAQIVALAKGEENKDLNKNFTGGRYSTLIYSNVLNPKNLGAILSFYENKVMFQGFLWNLNSFDQEGVQLGKKLTKKILERAEKDSNLEAYMNLLS